GADTSGREQAVLAGEERRLLARQALHLEALRIGVVAVAGERPASRRRNLFLLSSSALHFSTPPAFLRRRIPLARPVAPYGKERGSNETRALRPEVFADPDRTARCRSVPGAVPRRRASSRMPGDHRACGASGPARRGGGESSRRRDQRLPDGASGDVQ